MERQTERNYVAFISYRHLPVDADIAARLQRSLEQFRVPRPLRREGKARLGLVFRDEEELPASSDLSHDIRAALDRSEYLIVVCTPDTPASAWVRREIRCFLERHERGRVLAVLAAGEPASAFPPELTEGGVEPLAVNVCAPDATGRRRRLKREINRLYAALLGCPYDALVQRAQRRRRRQAAVAVGLVLAVALSFLAVLFWKNTQLEERNAALLLQRQAAQLSESRLLTARSGEELGAGETAAALRDAVDALPSGAEDDRPYYAPAESALLAGLGVFQGQGVERTLALESEARLDAPVRDLAVSEDGTVLVALDAYGGAFAYDLRTGAEKWTSRLSAGDEGFRLTGRSYGHVSVNAEADRVVFLLDSYVVALSLDTGDILWNVRSEGMLESFFAVSPDGETLACVEHTIIGIDSLNVTYTLSFLRADTGESLLRIPLAEDVSLLDFTVEYSDYTAQYTPAAFSADGKRFAAAYYEDERSVTSVFLADLETGEKHILREEAGLRPVWMDLDGDRLLILRQLEGEGCGLVFEAMDLQTGALLWQTEARPGQQNGFHSAASTRYAFLRTEDYLLAGADDVLYAFDPDSGDLRASSLLYDTILDIVQTQPHLFQFALANGFYATGWLSTQGGLRDSQGYAFGEFSLGEAAQARIGRGIHRAVVEGNAVVGFTANEGGCFALVRAEDERVLSLRRACATEGLATRRAVSLPEDERLGDALGGRGTRVCADGGMLVSFHRYDFDSDENHDGFLRLDAERAPVGDPVFYERDHGMDAWLLEDGSGLIEVSAYGDIAYTDFASGERRVLAERVTEELSVRADIRYVGNGTASAAAYRAADGSVLAARCDGAELRLWLDGAEQPPVKLPEGLAWSRRGKIVVDKLLTVGENGCVLLSSFAADADENRLDGFALYDSAGGRWTRFADEGAGSSERAVALGWRENVFAVADAGGIVRVYGPEKESVRAVRTQIPTGSVRALAFLPGDAHFAIYTYDGLLAVFDVETGGRVYATDVGVSYGDALLCGASPDGRRVYVSVGNTDRIFCLDAQSWSELGSASYSYGFDEAREEIWSNDYLNGWYAWRVPSREELIAVARRVCGEPAD